MRFKILVLLLVLFALPVTPAFADTLEDNSASVYAYFNISDDSQDSSLSFDQFQ